MYPKAEHILTQVYMVGVWGGNIASALGSTSPYSL